METSLINCAKLMQEYLSQCWLFIDTIVQVLFLVQVLWNKVSLPA